MPYTVNGVGTTYFGTSNRQVQDGVCESCQQRGKLVSYETWHCICVLFIPLIPLGKKQILNYCPSCSRHRVMPYRDWVKIRDQAIDETATQLSQSPDDPDKALEMHATLVSFQKQGEATKLAEMLEEKFADVARVQFYLAAWYERTGKTEHANRLFLRAYELEPNDVVICRAAMLTYVEQGELDQAKSMIHPFVPGTENFDPAMFYALATGFQKQGRHQEAAQTLRMLLDAAPSLKNDKTFRKALAASEKALGADELTIPAEPFYKTGGFRWVMAGTAIVAAVVLWNSYIASNRSVTVVNGLRSEIAVNIDGKNPVRVPAGGQTSVQLSEGRHEAEVTTPPNEYPKVAFNVATGWWERFLRRPIFVIDPTKSAAVIWEEAVYVPAGLGGDGPQARHELRFGEPFTSYKHIDYRFEEFPAQIKMDSKSGRVVKTRLAVLHDDILELIRQGQALGTAPAAMLPFVQTHLMQSPEREDVLPILAFWSMQADKEKECRDFLSRRLPDRPVRVEWHRMYQTLSTQGLAAAEAREQQEKLKQDYDRLLEKEPEDASLNYLRGRLEGYGRKSAPYFARALELVPKHPHALYASSHNRLVHGDFAKALELSKEANEAKPNDPQFKHGLTKAQFAAADYENLEKSARAELAQAPINPTAMETLLKTLIASQRTEDADREYAAFSARYMQILPGQYHNLMMPLKLTLAYMKGDFETLEHETANATDAEIRKSLFFAKLELGQLADLPMGLQPFDGAYWSLCRELVASRLGNKEQAAASREAALAFLDQATDDDWTVADVLRQAASVPWEDIEDLSCDASHKAVVLVLLAHQRPELRSQLLDLAEKLNYDLDFPHFLLAKEIAELRK